MPSPFHLIRKTRLGRAFLGSGKPAPREPDPETGEVPLDEEGESNGAGGISAWVEKRAQSVVSKIYDTRADDIEDRARRAVSSAYRDQADDLEERAVKAMRRALSAEADRIKQVIEHAVAVKKREARLSLLVLVTASLVYLALYWFTSRPSS